MYVRICIHATAYVVNYRQILLDVQLCTVQISHKCEMQRKSCGAF